MNFKPERRTLKRLFLYVSPNLNLSYTNIKRYLDRVTKGGLVTVIVPEPTYTPAEDNLINLWVRNNSSIAKVKTLKILDKEKDGYIQRMVDFVNITILVLDKDDQFGSIINEYCLAHGKCFNVYKPVIMAENGEEKNTH